MLDPIKRFVTKFHDKTFATLWLEVLLFSVLLGSLPHLWSIACLMFFGLSWILNKRWMGTYGDVNWLLLERLGLGNRMGYIYFCMWLGNSF